MTLGSITNLGESSAFIIPENIDKKYFDIKEIIEANRGANRTAFSYIISGIGEGLMV